MTMNETSSVKDQTAYNKKSQAVLPLMSENVQSKAKIIQEQLFSSTPMDRGSLGGETTAFNKNSRIINDFIGQKEERRDCSMGLRVPRRVKDLFEELSAETRLSESEILYRMVMRCIGG